MTNAKSPSIGAHLRQLLGRVQNVDGTPGVMAESTATLAEAAYHVAGRYEPHDVPSDISADEITNVARKAVADEPLDEREGFIAEAIILPDLRPAIDIIGGDFTIDHPAWRDYGADTPAHANFVQAIPSVGRIELPGNPGVPYGGTGFVVGEGLLMTNRHVAQLFASGLGVDGLQFISGIDPAVDFLRELDNQAGTPFAFRKIRMIHPYFDMALVEIEGLEGHAPLWLEPVELDAARPRRIAVVGYPAFDPRNRADVQDKVFRGVYNIKRFQPGLLAGRRNVDSFGKMMSAGCHDSSTLGGNSGSLVLSAETGDVVGLHFAGIYKDSNFAVPAVDLARDGRIIDAGVNIRGGGHRSDGPWEQWWRNVATPERPTTAGVPSTPAAVAVQAPAAVHVPDGGAVTISIPLQITVSLGVPDTGSAAQTVEALSLDEAIARLSQALPDGVVRVKPGFNGRTDVLVLAARPERFEVVRASAPAAFAGYPVDVRYATIDEQLGLTVDQLEVPGTIAYDDARRAKAPFLFDPVEEEMTVIAHVGPEESFPMLQEFLGKVQTTLTSSMYQFFAAHVMEAVKERLDAGGLTMKIVLDPATRDSGDGGPKDGEFRRDTTFEKWRDDFAFTNVYVPVGNGKLVTRAYHIKVSVADSQWVWLSSGNWTRSSQPKPVDGGARGNREWHIVLENRKLADMFEAHINADFDQCGELGGGEEAIAPAEIMVDVPEEIFLEAPVERLQPLRVTGRSVKVQPVLTPDRRGRIYTDAVLSLIHSARRQLVFQNQYIKIRKDMAGNLDELVEALIAKSKEIADLRIILRAGDVDDDITELRRRGLDVARCVRIITNTHTKGIIADGQRVLVGSQNWSDQAVSTNRDASLLFDDAEIAAYFLKAFEIDWARARPAVALGVEKPALIAQGAGPPPGYVRMPLSEYYGR
ncbi:phospholipase D-like domain-containing protein [Sphingobium yanoikuyae]|uniref:Phospholipase D n=1 Tax=Sphingobium yanoikuyae TaxID=13690 RepID=A0AA43B9U9_SPHYA|nr:MULTISPECIES: phospholipase D-like domain-containing protein [Sphingobium]MBV2150308.1 trypsin-like peptidase domain-containing protein [Sphingobium sp. AS12]MDH2129614.1 phospholipase D-like domain-containing protein [Sphingobium yanoikuyae]MDH2149708.1 phospholipase D-like domain-containing protein [Sphingobium yanoikuyae]MDH2165467.1 phospholipase D-like domain-containing protein [Sphingobium yanoikuyae]QWT14244.1 trypsin-like peptidase domain-containing protein [Sphingobium xenophagum]